MVQVFYYSDLADSDIKYFAMKEYEKVKCTNDSSLRVYPVSLFSTSDFLYPRFLKDCNDLKHTWWSYCLQSVVCLWTKDDRFSRSDFVSPLIFKYSPRHGLFYYLHLSNMVQGSV